jgi:RNA polymerase sigma factor (sigma-70 family)
LTNNELIEGCRKGKRKAQDQLYRLYAGRLFGVCLRYTRNRMEAEDMLQEGFIRIFRKFDTFREDNEHALYGWLRRVMVNFILNYMRDNRKLRFTDSMELSGDQWPDITDGHDIHELFESVSHEEILQIINELPDGYRAVFNLYAFEEYKHADIAGILGISESTSKTQLMKARRTIIGKLNQRTAKEMEFKLVAHE